MPYDAIDFPAQRTANDLRPLPSAAGIVDCLRLMEQEAGLLGLDVAQRLLGAVAVAVMDEALSRHAGPSLAA
ncbi:hypothetical protein [Neoroseomonas rubea]|uniref:hypothetical protein n=1 Tax=Neoroseomonas rubea TaxID=2748666 RepID=UPI0018DF6971|nr:hypothetical protein [Roseomonas rubea]